jgi:FKBP-type peptidyl-prolyl cis-trans isomerase SlyD
MDESGGEPLTYLHGHSQIVPGLEAALEGQTSGANVKVTVSPKEGYGEKSSKGTVKIPNDEFPEGAEPEIGMALDAVGPDGKNVVLWVIGRDEECVEVSLDHPLAGVTLHFDVTVREVRTATKEELAHGHVHGPGDHHHH